MDAKGVYFHIYSGYIQIFLDFLLKWGFEWYFRLLHIDENHSINLYFYFVSSILRQKSERNFERSHEKFPDEPLTMLA